MNENKSIDRIESLLKLCQKLQSEKDGIDRPEPGTIDKTKTLDEFAMDIREAIRYVNHLYELLLMEEKLSKIGRVLEQKDKINVDLGKNYSHAVLDYIIGQYNLK